MPQFRAEISDEDHRFIQSEIDEDSCASTTEFLEKALADYRRARAMEELDRLHRKAVESGDAFEVTPEYWERKTRELQERKRAAAR